MQYHFKPKAKSKTLESDKEQKIILNYDQIITDIFQKKRETIPTSGAIENKPITLTATKDHILQQNEHSIKAAADGKHHRNGTDLLSNENHFLKFSENFLKIAGTGAASPKKECNTITNSKENNIHKKIKSAVNLDSLIKDKKRKGGQVSASKKSEDKAGQCTSSNVSSFCIGNNITSEINKFLRNSPNNQNNNSNNSTILHQPYSQNLLKKNFFNYEKAKNDGKSKETQKREPSAVKTFTDENEIKKIITQKLNSAGEKKLVDKKEPEKKTIQIDPKSRNSNSSNHSSSPNHHPHAKSSKNLFKHSLVQGNRRKNGQCSNLKNILNVLSHKKSSSKQLFLLPQNSKGICVSPSQNSKDLPKKNLNENADVSKSKIIIHSHEIPGIACPLDFDRSKSDYLNLLANDDEKKTEVVVKNKLIHMNLVPTVRTSLYDENNKNQNQNQTANIRRYSIDSSLNGSSGIIETNGYTRYKTLSEARDKKLNSKHSSENYSQESMAKQLSEKEIDYEKINEKLNIISLGLNLIKRESKKTFSESPKVRLSPNDGSPEKLLKNIRSKLRLGNTNK